MGYPTEIGPYRGRAPIACLREISFQAKTLRKTSQFRSNAVGHRSLLRDVPSHLIKRLKIWPLLWYLVVSILCLTPLQSELSSLWVTLLPLSLVLCSEIAKLLYLEISNTLQGREENERIAWVWNGTEFEKIRWKDIYAGQIVYVLEGQMAPADLVLVTTSNPNHIAFFDKHRVTGSKAIEELGPVKEMHISFSLSESQAVEEIYPWISRLSGNLQVPPPSPEMRTFRGHIQMSRSLKQASIKKKNFVPRGYLLTNTRWIVGIVAYTGNDTKIWQVYNSAFCKQSIFGISNNRFALLSGLLIVGLSLLGLLLNLVSAQEQPTDSGAEYMAFLTLYSAFMPLSYILVTDLIKYFMSREQVLKEMGCSAHSLENLENLGSIDYVLTGKTNCVADQIQTVQNIVVNATVYSVANSQVSNQPGQSYAELDLDFKDLYHLAAKGSDEQITKLLTAVALCNNCSVTQAEVPSQQDELLVRLAASFGCQLDYKDTHVASLNYLGQRDYLIEAFQYSTSDSRRTRVLVKDQSSDEILMLVRGEPQSMLHLLALSREQRIDLRSLIKKALVGNKSLVYAYRRFSPEELKEFVTAYDMARLSPINKEARIENLFSEYETDLTYIGMLGIEHRIAPSTKACISSLKKAGIKFWMVSGDSESASVSAAVGSGIVPHDFRLLRLNDIQTEHECLQRLEELVCNLSDPNISDSQFASEDEELESSESVVDRFAAKGRKFSFVREDPEPLKKPTKNGITMALRPLRSVFSQLKTKKLELSKPLRCPQQYNVCAAIEGLSLHFALQSVQTRRLLVALLNIAHSVVFYNMLPYQKKQVIKLIKGNFTKQAQVLAIGGEIEDIPMLQEADISVRTYHLDGFVADLAVPEMAKLSYVTLCLGHWAMLNVAKATTFCLYFGTLMGITSVLYLFYCDFSASALLPFGYQFFLADLLFLLPVMSVGVADKDKTRNDLLNNEELYKEGKHLMQSYLRMLIEAAGLGILHGLVVFFMTVVAAESLLLTEGFAADGKYMAGLIFVGLYLTGLTTVYFQVLDCSLRSLSGFLGSLLCFLSFVIWEMLGGDGAYAKLVLEPSSYLVWGIVGVSNIALTIISLLLHSERAAALFRRRVTTEVFISEVLNSNIMQFFKDSKDWAQAEEKDNFKMKKFSQKFCSVERERNYYALKLYRLYNGYTVFYLMLVLYFGLVFSLAFVFVESSTLLMASTALSATLLVAFLLLDRTAMASNNYKEYVFSYFLVLVLLTSLQYCVLDYMASLTAPMLLVAMLLSYNIEWVYSCLGAGLLCGAVLVGSAVTLSTEDNAALLIVEMLVHLVGFVVTSTTIAYKLERSQREEFVTQQRLELEASKVNSVLSCLLPGFVRKRVRDGVRYIAEDQGTVTVIFCNFCDFLDIVEHFSPQEITSFLDQTFRKFDHLCESVGVTKIETVGYTYMACVGLRDSDAEVPEEYRHISHARRAIEFGLLLLGAVNGIMLHTGKCLQVKIGIHSGPVAAGVVGRHKPQFSLVGDTVNTASRMATTLPFNNHIQFSKETKRLLTETEGLVFNPSSVQVKGKGEMKVYRVSLEDLRNQELIAQVPSPGLKNFNSLLSKKSVKSLTAPLEPPGVAFRKSTVYALVDVNNTREFLKKKGIFKLVGNLNLNSFRLRYSSEDESFRQATISNMRQVYLTGLHVKIATLLLRTATLVYSVSFLGSPSSSLIFSSVSSLTYAVMRSLLNKYLHRISYAWALQVIILVETLGYCLLYYFESEASALVLFFLVVYNLLYLTHCSLLLFNEATCVTLLAASCWVVAAFSMSSAECALTSVALTFVLSLFLLLLYKREQKLRFVTNYTHAGNNEIKEIERLLCNMFPPQIYDELKNDTVDINKFYGVTLLYADIVGFTEWSSNKLPRDVVEMLSELFTRFDEQCQLYSLYKVHTIGDCYVVMGYNNVGNRDPGQEALRMVDFAHAMIQIIQEVNRDHGAQLNMRIGMHTGDIIGGITGSNLVRYDIYGVDVLIANQVESHGLPGVIAVSNHTKNLIEQFRRYRFKFENINNFTIHDNDIDVFKLIDSQQAESST